MADEKIQAGDIVQVKSGGPQMTATSVADRYGTPTVWCSWFEGTKANEGTFPLVALKRIKAG
jgi:uncharacterized protein YodC (DUF2158 family)